MDDLLLKIVGMHRAEFEKAKRYEHLAWLLQFVVTFCALLTVLINVDVLSYVLALIALVFACTRWYLSFQADNYRGVAERARRVLTLVNGLGYEVSTKELTDLISNFSVSEVQAKQWEDPEYFIDKDDRGYYRFGVFIQESAFFSKHLFKKSALRAWIVFALILSVSVLALFVLPSIGHQQWAMRLAQIISLILMFLVSIDAMGRSLAFTKASNAVTRIDDRLHDYGSSNISDYDLIYIWGDYNAAVQSAPLIPTKLYEKNKTSLNDLFAQRITNNS